MRISAQKARLDGFEIVLRLDPVTAKDLMALMCHNVTIPEALTDPKADTWEGIKAEELAARFRQWAPVLREALDAAFRMRA